MTILDKTQQKLAERFAGFGPSQEDRFFGLKTYELITGAPFFPGGLAKFDCRVVAAHEIGGSTLFIAEVIAVENHEVDHPLLYYSRAYRHLDIG